MECTGDGGDQPISKFNVKLYRRLINHQKAKNSDFNFMIWGYFDGLQLNPIGKMKEFHIADQGTDFRLQNAYEIHHLCAYSRKYSSEKISSIFEQVPNKPLLVLAELKLNENIVKQFMEQYDDFFDQLQNYLEEKIAYFAKERNCDFDLLILSSLGYSDFILILRGSDYQQMVDTVNYLRALKYADKQNNEINFLRSTYSISGVHLNSIEEIQQEKKYNVSIRFSFRKIVDFCLVRDEVIKSLNVDKGSISFGTVFGKYDLDLEGKNVSLYSLVGLFNRIGNKKNTGLLDPQNDFQRNYIGYTNTRWLMDLPVNDLNTKNDLQGIVAAGQHEDNFSEIINLLVPQSLKVSFIQLIQSFYQIERNEASEPLLIYELNKILELFTKQIQDGLIYSEHLEQNEKKEYRKNHFENIAKAINLISQLLYSRVQAFRFFSELPIYENRTSQSITKVFVMYMAVVEEMEKVINDIFRKQDPNDSKFINLFVILGNSDIVKSYKLFPLLKDSLVLV